MCKKINFLSILAIASFRASLLRASLLCASLMFVGSQSFAMNNGANDGVRNGGTIEDNASLDAIINDILDQTHNLTGHEIRRMENALPGRNHEINAMPGDAANMDVHDYVEANLPQVSNRLDPVDLEELLQQLDDADDDEQESVGNEIGGFIPERLVARVVGLIPERERVMFTQEYCQWKRQIEDFYQKYANDNDAVEDYFIDGPPTHIDISYYIKKGDIAGVRMKCGLHGFNVNAKSVLGKDTPLNLAIRAGNLEIVNVLLGFGAKYNSDSIRIAMVDLEEKIEKEDRKFVNRFVSNAIKKVEKIFWEPTAKKAIKAFVLDVIKNFDTPCSICLDLCMENKEENGGVVELKCKHRFHGDCIYEWLNSGKDTCPNCREKVIN